MKNLLPILMILIAFLAIGGYVVAIAYGVTHGVPSRGSVTP